MPAVANLVQETSGSNGDGNLVLTAVNARQRFSEVFATGGADTFDYFIVHTTANQWERGTGSLSDANTLVRDTVIEGTNGASPVNFSSGGLVITNDVPAAKQVQTDLAQTLTNKTIDADLNTITNVGDVTGPASATDNVLPRFNGATGKVIQDSPVTVNDSGDMTGVGTITASGAITSGGNTVWHPGNDGTGSGLDADLLDGNEAADFALASHTHVLADITDSGALAALDTVAAGQIDSNAVTEAKINAGAVTEAKIGAGAVTVAKIATGTDGELITWDASGNPATVSVGTAGQVLTSNGAGAAPTFQDSGSGGWQFIEKITTDGTENAMISGDLSGYSTIRIFVSGQPDVTDQLKFQAGTSGPTWLGSQKYAYWRQNNQYTYNAGGAAASDPADGLTGLTDTAGFITLTPAADDVDATTSASGIMLEMIITNFNRTVGRRGLVVNNLFYTTSSSQFIGLEHAGIGLIEQDGTALQHVQFYWDGSATDWRDHSYMIIEGIV